MKKSKSTYYKFCDSLTFGEYLNHLILEYSKIPYSVDYSCMYYYSQTSMNTNFEVFKHHMYEDFSSHIAIDSAYTFMVFADKYFNKVYSSKNLSPNIFLAKNFSKFAFNTYRNNCKYFDSKRFKTEQKFLELIDCDLPFYNDDSSEEIISSYNNKEIFSYNFSKGTIYD